MSLSFYQDLPVLSDFAEITNLNKFIEVPSDWYIVISDVINSREAIQKGEYKSVNTIGAASIISVINALGTNEFPYVFGGDGASICIPPELLDIVKDSFLGTKKMALNAFNLDLRVGAVTVAEIKKQGGQVLLSKMKVCDWYSQAIFAGGGIAIADKLLKQHTDRYQFQPDANAIADFTGLECRWNKVTQPNKRVLSLLIKTTASSAKGMKDYRSIIDTINTFVPSDHPISESNLSFSWNADWLKNEYKSRSFFSSFGDKIKYVLDLYYRIFLGIVLMKFNIKIGDFYWGDYKPNLVASSDYKKFDDMLRAVISCTEEEKQTLIAYLDRLEKEKVIVYGIHESEAALVTCVIKQYSGFHFHFIDGDDGGYAMAATNLTSKEKLLS